MNRCHTNGKSRDKLEAMEVKVTSDTITGLPQHMKTSQCQMPLILYTCTQFLLLHHAC